MAASVVLALFFLLLLCNIYVMLVWVWGPYRIHKWAKKFIEYRLQFQSRLSLFLRKKAQARAFLKDYEGTRSKYYQQHYQPAKIYMEKAEQLGNAILKGLRSWHFIIPDSRDKWKLFSPMYLSQATNSFLTGFLRLFQYEYQLRASDTAYLQKAEYRIASLQAVPSKLQEECVQALKARIYPLGENIRAEQEAGILMSKLKGEQIYLETRVTDLVLVFSNPGQASIKEIDQSSIHLANILSHLHQIESKVSSIHNKRLKVDALRDEVRKQFLSFEEVMKSDQPDDRIQAIQFQITSLIANADKSRHYQDFNAAEKQLTVALHETKLGLTALTILPIAKLLFRENKFSLRPLDVESVLERFDNLLRSVVLIKEDEEARRLQGALQTSINEITLQRRLYDKDVQKLETEQEAELSQMKKNWQLLKQIAGLEKDPLNIRYMLIHQEVRNVKGKPTKLQVFNPRVAQLSNEMDSAYRSIIGNFAKANEQIKSLRITTATALEWSETWPCLSRLNYEMKTNFEGAARYWTLIGGSSTLDEMKHNISQTLEALRRTNENFFKIRNDYNLLESYVNKAARKLEETQRMVDQAAVYARDWPVFRTDAEYLRKLNDVKKSSFRTAKQQTLLSEVLLKLKETVNSEEIARLFAKMKADAEGLYNLYTPMYQTLQALSNKLVEIDQNAGDWVCLLPEIKQFRTRVTQLQNGLEKVKSQEERSVIENAWSFLNSLETSARDLANLLGAHFQLLLDLEEQTKELYDVLSERQAQAKGLPDNWVCLRDSKQKIFQSHATYQTALLQLRKQSTLTKAEQFVEGFREEIMTINVRYEMVVKPFWTIRKSTEILAGVNWPNTNQRFRNNIQKYSAWTWCTKDIQYVQDTLSTTRGDLDKIKSLEHIRMVQEVLSRVDRNLSIVEITLNRLDRHCHNLNMEVVLIERDVAEINRRYSGQITSHVQQRLRVVNANLRESKKNSEYDDAERLLRAAKATTEILVNQAPSVSIENVYGANFGNHGTVNQNLTDRPQA